VNRKLLVVVIVAAVLALVVGAAVGRNLISPDGASAPRADVVRFKDEVSKFSIAYPASWRVLPATAGDGDLSLRVARDDAASMQVRSTVVGLENVTKQSLPVVKKFTDDLLSEDKRVQLLKQPDPVELGGVPGYRYRYTYGEGATGGAHDHYFLFKDRRMIQLVFQAVPATRLAELESTFQRIAGTFEGDIT